MIQEMLYTNLIMNKGARNISKNLYIERETFQPVDAIEPKRCYVTSQTINNLDESNERYTPQLSREVFQKRLQLAKDIVLGLSEEELDASIASAHYPKRLRAYNSVQWYKGVVHADEIGVWKGAGGLPRSWTEGSLKETAMRVSQALQEGSNILVARAKRAIPRMRENLDIIASEPYLYPIILPGGTMGRGLYGRSLKGFRLMKGDIEDGCMRSITLVASGREQFIAYVGIKR
jgi:hypothetical protein